MGGPAPFAKWAEPAWSPRGGWVNKVLQDRAACRPGTAPARDRQHIPRPIPPSRAARRRCAAVGPRHELSGGRRGVRVARETRSPSRGRGGGRGGVKPAKRARAEGAHSLHANPHSKRCGGRRAVCELRLPGTGTRGPGQLDLVTYKRLDRKGRSSLITSLSGVLTYTIIHLLDSFCCLTE